MEKDYYVYAYLNPMVERNFFNEFVEWNFACFYIGKGCKNRCNKRVNEALNGKSTEEMNYIVNNIHSAGLEPIVVKIKENLTEKQAFILENYMINELGIHNLVNEIYGRHQEYIDGIV